MVLDTPPFRSKMSKKYKLERVHWGRGQLLQVELLLRKVYGRTEVNFCTEWTIHGRQIIAEWIFSPVRDLQTPELV